MQHPTNRMLLPWESHCSTPILLDGGWGTTLIHQEGFHQQCFARHNLTHPEKIYQIAHHFLNAGSEILLTNTFHASPLALEPFGFANQWKAINQAGVQISLQAAQKKATVFASMGPLLPLHKTFSRFKKKIQKEAREQAIVLENSGAQGIVLETFTHPAETKLVVETVLNHVSIPVGLTVCFGFGKDQLESPAKWSISQFVQDFCNYPLAFWGANCGTGFHAILPLIPYFSEYSKPIWLKPNVNDAPEIQALLWEKLFQPKVCFVGGCCGTTFAHIETLKKARTHFFSKGSSPL